MRTLSLAVAFAVSLAGIAAGQKVAPAPAKGPPPKTDVNVVATSVPGLPTPRLKLVAGLTIDGKKEHLDNLGQIDISPDGQLAVRTSYGTMVVFDSLGRHLWRKDLRDQNEIGNIGAIGWRGSEMWVSDGRYSQVALLDHGTVTKSLEIPTWIRPTFGNRASFPVFGGADVRALFADGSMIVLPFRAHSVVGTVGYDSTMQYVVRVNESGIIQKTITKYPNINAASRVAFDRADRARSDVPNRWLFRPEYWPRLLVSTDGKRIVTVSVDTSSATTDSIVVAAVNDQGESLYTRKFGFPRRSYTQAEIDSIAAQRFSRSDAATRAAQVGGLPRKMPSIREVTIGRDYSVWVALLDANGARPVVGIDGAGRMIGTAYIPAIFQVKAADRGSLWIVDYRWSQKDIVRYAIAKP